MKKCSVCKEVKSLDLFHVNNKSPDKRQYYCKACKADHYKSDPDCNRRNNYKKRYGITVDDYNSMLEEQGHRCAICKAESPDKRCVRFHVDHCHTTGKVRGLLCNNCNIGLGKFQDNPQFLIEAAKYLNE